MMIAIMSECGTQLDDDVLEAILDKAIFFVFFVFPLTLAGVLILILPFFYQTFQDADADKDGKISKEEWKKYVDRNPTLLKYMTLPALK